MVAAAVLHVDDGDLRVLPLDLVHKPVAAIDPRAAGLVVHDDGDLALIPDQRGQLIGRQRGRGDVVRRGGGDRDVAVHPRVEPNDRNVVRAGPLEQWDHRFAVERGQADRAGVFVERGLQHLDLLVDLRLVLGSFERDRDVVLRRGLLGALPHGLPELVLEALRDHRDERLRGW